MCLRPYRCAYCAIVFVSWWVRCVGMFASVHYCISLSLCVCTCVQKCVSLMRCICGCVFSLSVCSKSGKRAENKPCKLNLKRGQDITTTPPSGFEKQAPKPRSYASLKERPSHWQTDRLRGVGCKAPSEAKKWVTADTTHCTNLWLLKTFGNKYHSYIRTYFEPSRGTKSDKSYE